MSSTNVITMAAGSEGVLYTVLEEVAETEGVDVLDLPPLGLTLDPGALEELLESQGDVRVTFRYAGYEVEATADSVSVSEVS